MSNAIVRKADPEEIPIISLADTSLNIPTNIRNACRNVGFFFIKDHGIDPEIIKNLELLSREFFELPEKEKMEISMDKAGVAWRGYFPVGGELTSGKPDGKEGIYFGRELDDRDLRVQQGIPLHGKNLFPRDPEKLKDFVLKYLEEMNRIGEKLMEWIGLSLNLEKNYFTEAFSKEPTILFRIFSYPVASENFVWGVGEHTDYGFLTILLQDSQEGLEIQNIHGEWIAAPSIEGTLVVNIGDMLEICTGGFYRSTPHRVRNRTGKSRLSFPFFYDPGFLSKVESIPEHAKEFIKEYSEKFPIQRSVESSRRWDQQDLASFEGIIYGKYLLGKVSKVFPNLASENLNDYFLQQ